MKKLLTGSIIGAVLAGGIVLPSVSADEPYNHPQREILRAARSGDAALKAVLARGVSINATDDDGETALMEAADERRADTLRVLVANGADVNRADEDGETALMIAADEGNLEAVRILLDAGANINARDEDGETALDKAIDERHRDVADALRAAGAR